MKERIAYVLLVGMLSCILGCGYTQTIAENDAYDLEPGIMEVNSQEDMVEENSQDAIIEDNLQEDNEVDAKNRTMIAQALGIEEDSRNIRFILAKLNVLEAGQLQSAVYGKEDVDNYIDIVAEDGTNYRMYLIGSGSVDSVKNLDTGDWPIQSDR